MLRRTRCHGGTPVALVTARFQLSKLTRESGDMEILVSSVSSVGDGGDHSDLAAMSRSAASAAPSSADHAWSHRVSIFAAAATMVNASCDASFETCQLPNYGAHTVQSREDQHQASLETHCVLHGMVSGRISVAMAALELGQQPRPNYSRRSACGPPRRPYYPLHLGEELQHPFDHVPKAGLKMQAQHRHRRVSQRDPA
jgi:hypothetical protein